MSFHKANDILHSEKRWAVVSSLKLHKKNTVLHLNKECYQGLCAGKFEYLSAHMWNVVADISLASLAHLI